MVGLLLVGCTDHNADDDASRKKSPVDRAAAALAEMLPSVDAPSLMVIDYLHRNWDVAALADAAPLARQRMRAADRSADDALLDRLIDPESALPPASAIAASRLPTTRVLASALQCDRRPLSDAEVAALTSLAGGGGYDTTHAALAVQWMAELGCPQIAALTAEIIGRITSEVQPVVPDSVGAVTDLALEQSSVLCYLGATERVPKSWPAVVAAAQRDDGGWVDGENTWHTTLLALWTLLAMESPGNGVSMVRTG